MYAPRAAARAVPPLSQGQRHVNGSAIALAVELAILSVRLTLGLGAVSMFLVERPALAIHHGRGL